jgi:hypothetical protein
VQALGRELDDGIRRLHWHRYVARRGITGREETRLAGEGYRNAGMHGRAGKWPQNGHGIT